MYTFVYRTFIKFILFCRGQAPDVFLQFQEKFFHYCIIFSCSIKIPTKMPYILLGTGTGCSMPSRAYTSFLRRSSLWMWVYRRCVNALSGLYLISTIKTGYLQEKSLVHVSMPSRAYTSFLR